MTMEVRNLLSQAKLDTSGHGSGNSTPRKPNPVVVLTPPPHKPKELPQLVDTSSQVSTLGDAKMAEASIEGVPNTISPISTTTRSRSITPPADVAELWENANKALEELLATKASIDAHRQRAIWELGVELCRNESATAESIKEARAVCSCVTLDPEALCLATVKAAKVTYVQTVKEAKNTHTCTIWEAEAACPAVIRDAETQGPLRPNHSTGNMAKPSRTWRNKSSERKAEAKLTSSPPVRLPYMPAQWSSKACWWFLITFCWGSHLCPTHSPYHKGPPQQSNSLSQQLLLHQCPSSPLGPKGGILPQILWTAHLWVGPHPRQPQKGLPAPNSERSHIGTRHSSRATQKHSARTLTW